MRLPTQTWLGSAIDEASSLFYDKPAAAMGEGGTIPFMAMLGKHFPDAQFLITGVLGPHANAHGPNEFLHVPYAKKLTACVAFVLAAHARKEVHSMITIYHLDTSRSERIVWLMEELGLEYKLELFQRNDNGSAPDAMRKIHALGKAPVIRDGNTVLGRVRRHRRLYRSPLCGAIVWP